MSSPQAFDPVNTIFAPMHDQPVEAPSPEKFSFTGSGSEYFRIWIVNLLLSIVTLGIYSAWAKVRKTRYFYDSTRLAGASFEYHGNPMAILKGRLIALVLIGGYQIVFKFSVVLGFIALLLVIFLLPWLVWKSMQFRLYNSSYRGIRFGFRGSLGKTYFAFLLLPLLTMMTAYLLMPLAHQQIKKFQHEESRFGSTHFSFHATPENFYKTYLIGFLIVFGGVLAIGIAFGGTIAGIFAAGGAKKSGAAGIALIGLAIFAVYLWIVMSFPIFLTLIQNLIWRNTRLGKHQFRSDMKWGKVVSIALTNLFGIFLTLGLFIPFAQIRSIKYRIESMSLIPDSSLDHFISDSQAQTSATGEGVADLLGFDLSL